MTRKTLLLTICFLLIGCTLPTYAATTACAYKFKTGSGDSLLQYCVTVNGNIPQLSTPQGAQWISSGGEGYGICDQNAPMNYTDYGVSDSGNWGTPTLVSHTTTSVKIARVTADGHWTLTQTITMVPATSSITMAMALTNNQSFADRAYILRFANAYLPTGNDAQFNEWLETANSAFVWTKNDPFTSPNFGLILQNKGNPSPAFLFFEGYANTQPYRTERM